MMRHVQIHTLRDYAVSLPNRGAEGLAKRAVYGGTERQRISSQCIKRALRTDQSMVRTSGDGVDRDTMDVLAEDLGIGLSVRSALIGDRRLKPMLQDAGLSEGDAKTWAGAVMALWRKGRETNGDKEAGVTDDERAAPVVIGEQELRLLAQVVQVLCDAGRTTKDLRELFDKPNKLRKESDDIQKAIHAIKAAGAHAGLDGSLFGRMATGVAVSNVDSAVHVAHALTVHPLVSISDFFSVTDDLRDVAAGERGGSHINTMELTTGLFYHYAVIDLQQLETNLSQATTNEQRAQLVGWLVRALSTVQPAAKKGSTAPYSGLRELVVEIGSRQPRTLMGAYESPVEVTSGSSLSETAREKLRSYAEEMDQLVGAPAHRYWLREYADSTGDRTAVESLAEAVTAVLN